MWRPTCDCGGTVFESEGYGMDFCTDCGLGCRGEIADTRTYFTKDRVLVHNIYTRRKRFKKYLQRANRAQSMNTVPRETWEYLLERAPFRNAQHVHRTLKAAKHLKRKCYDSLPFLCSHLCEGPVPSLTPLEMQRAMELFDRIDHALNGETMISYLYCLEYILVEIGRRDMVSFVNRIKCEKRRQHYKERLDRLFGKGSAPVTVLLRATVALELEVPGEPALAPDGASRLQVGLLAGQETGRRVDVGPGRFG